MNSTDFVATTSMLPAMVPMGQTFQVPISFRPTAANARNAIVVVKAAGLMAPVQVKVDGTGKLLTISCSPDDKNFGNVPVGQTKMDKVTCRNSDTSSIDFIAAFSDFPDDWSVDPGNGTLAGSTGGEDGLVTLNLDFHPSSTGPRTTTLTIKTKDGITVGTVSIDGNGTTPPKDKPMQEVGCSYSGSGRTATPYGFMIFALLGGLALLRRRRLA
jgi:MYXO-CTERM domain-containing protein